MAAVLLLLMEMGNGVPARYRSRSHLIIKMFLASSVLLVEFDKPLSLINSWRGMLLFKATKGIVYLNLLNYY